MVAIVTNQSYDLTFFANSSSSVLGELFCKWIVYIASSAHLVEGLICASAPWIFRWCQLHHEDDKSLENTKP